MAGTGFIANMARGIAKAEGYFNSGTLPNRNNNPGDLSGCCWAGETGTSRSSGDGATCIAAFDCADDGWAALIKDLTNHIAKNPQQTLAAFMASYSHAHGTALSNYIDTVMGELGISDPNTKLGDLGACCCG